ncbi:MFS transporter [Streptomyces castrisilvae]|uniref:MFS transporter n=1 Tax=Streptomyces castrisilvae TaxID=3033811 RepID=A0ABY9HLA3_9ACTN|nr:MFS transporter [Streptomyces sp. Mut1]WLQ34798.1 MFS transporter [Streptomyces sp. Mut1]
MTHDISSSPHAAHPHAATRNGSGLMLALLCAAQFMLVLDVTVVNVALPDMAADLHLDRTALTWVVTAYTLCFGGLMLLGGRLADALGARRTLLAGLALFTAASLACGLAGSAPVLIAGRIAQGVGAALLSPAALALLTTSFHGPARARALGVWAAIGGTGSAVGVLAGGALTGGPGWAWIFYVNVPVGLALLAALPAVVPPRAPRRSGGLDLPGAVLVTAGTGALIYGLVEAGDGGWAGTGTLLPLAAAAVLYAVFAGVERAARKPLMDLRMFTRRPVLAGAFLMLVATGLLIAFFFLGSVYLQHARGLGAMRTGLVFLPVAVAVGAGAHLGSRLVTTAGSRATAVGGMVIATAACAPLAGLGAHSSVYGVLMPGLAVAAFGLGAVFVTATTTALGMVAHEEAGLASGVVNTFHEVGGSVGVAVVSTVAAAGIEGAPGTSAGFGDAFLVCAVAAAGCAALSAVLVPRGKPETGGTMPLH